MSKQGNCLEKYIMQRTMPGAQRQGKPCTAWMDNIKTWTGLPVEESIRMTEFGRREISCGPAMDHGHEAQPCCPGRDVARRCVEPVADHVHSTRLQVCGECTASQRQLDNVDKSRRRLPVLWTVAPCMDHPAACLLDVQGRCHCPPPHQIQRHRHRHLPTMLMQRDTVVLWQLLWPAGAPVDVLSAAGDRRWLQHPRRRRDQLSRNSNLVHRLSISPSLPMTNDPCKGHGYGHVTNFRLLHPLKYLWNG